VRLGRVADLADHEVAEGDPREVLGVGHGPAAALDQALHVEVAEGPEGLAQEDRHHGDLQDRVEDVEELGDEVEA